MEFDVVNASRAPTIPGTKAHAASVLPLLLMWLHVRWWTFIAALILTVVVVVLNHLEISPLWLWARFKSRLRAGKVSARPYYYRRSVGAISIAHVDISLLRIDQE